MRAKVLDGAEHLDVEALGLGAAEDGEPVALHAGFDLGDRHDRFARRRNRLGELQRQGDGREEPEGGGEGDEGEVAQGLVTIPDRGGERRTKHGLRLAAVKCGLRLCLPGELRG